MGIQDLTAEDAMPQREMLYAGVDAGGSHTRCVLADARGTVVAIARSGPGNATVAGRERALASLREAVLAALAGRYARIAHLHVAAAGTTVPEGLADLADARTTSHDTAAAFTGALVQGPGLIVIAGTGSAGYGEDGAGRGTLHGGWGPMLDDPGSGYAIGHAALLALADVYDERRPHGILTRALAARLGVDGRDTLLACVYERPLTAATVAAVAPVVPEAAAAGDEAAQRILARAGTDLGDLAGTLAVRLDLQRTALRVATLGGAFNAGPYLQRAFEETLRRYAPGARIVAPRFLPLIGALLLSFRGAGIPAGDDLLAQVKTSLHAYEAAQGRPA